LERVEEITNPELRIVGFKDVGVPHHMLRDLSQALRSQRRQVALEVVSLDERAELKSVEMALFLKVDYLLGGTRADKVVDHLRGSNIRYFPFPGRVIGHPSSLLGTAREIAEEAKQIAQIHGVSGLDLLAYRSLVDPEELMTSVVSAVNIPVIIAGSINSPARVAAVASSNAWGFTVGAAALDLQFAPGKRSLNDQVDAILAMRNLVGSAKVEV
jgi:hypothetical protein